MPVIPRSEATLAGDFFAPEKAKKRHFPKFLSRYVTTNQEREVGDTYLSSKKRKIHPRGGRDARKLRKRVNPRGK
jgi:hypothetical protein